jgi:hypothetical protein
MSQFMNQLTNCPPGGGMESRTVVLNVAEVVRELTHNADDNSALRVQLYHELERLITESSAERLGLDGTLSWTLDALSETEKSSAAEIARQRVVELCERRAAEVSQHFARAETARANFAYLHEPIEPDHNGNGSHAPRTVSGQVGFVRIDFAHTPTLPHSHTSSDPIRVTTSNVRDDLRQAVRDAERAAMWYLSELGLHQSHRPGNGIGLGLDCELDDVELTRGGRSLAAAALVAIVSRVLSPADLFAVPRDVVISGDLAYNEKKKAWELKPVDGEDKVRIVETYYPHLRRVVLVARIAEQPRLFLHIVEVVPVASLTDLMQAVFGEDCEERFRLAIEQLNGRQDYQRFKQRLSQQTRWALILSPLLSLLICGAALFLLRQTSTQTPPPRRSTPNTEKTRPKEPDSTSTKMEQPPQPTPPNVPQPLNIPPSFPQPLPAVAPADAAQQRFKREIEEALWNAIVREIQFCIDPERVGKGGLYEFFLPPSLGGAAAARIEKRVEDKKRVTTETRPIQFHVISAALTSKNTAVATTREAYLWGEVVNDKIQEPKRFAYLYAYSLKKPKGRWLVASSRELPYPDKPSEATLRQLVKQPDLGGRIFPGMTFPPVEAEPPKGITRSYRLMTEHWEHAREKHGCDALFLERSDVNAPEKDLLNRLKDWGWQGHPIEIPLYVYNCGKETWKKGVHHLQWWMQQKMDGPEPPRQHVVVDKDIQPGEIWTTRFTLPVENLSGPWCVFVHMSVMSWEDEFGDRLKFLIVNNQRPQPPTLRDLKILDPRKVLLRWEDNGLNDDDNPRPQEWGNVRLKYKAQIQGVNRQFDFITPDWMAGGSHTAALPSWGTYRWRVKSFDGMEESEWSDWGNNFMMPP